MIFTVAVHGYTVLVPGKWDIGLFFSYYTMIFICIVLYGGWKVIKRTRIVKASEADLVWERPVIDAYEAAFVEQNVGFWREMMEMAYKRKPLKHVE